MRVTVNLPGDVYQSVRSCANLKGISLGEALSELVRAGLVPVARMNMKKAFPCFDLPAGAKPITLEQTLNAEE